jgi:hypothetical protein
MVQWLILDGLLAWTFLIIRRRVRPELGMRRYQVGEAVTGRLGWERLVRNYDASL